MCFEQKGENGMKTGANRGMALKAYGFFFLAIGFILTLGLVRLYRAFCVNSCPINENWEFFV
jgi:hypothetical protein